MNNERLDTIERAAKALPAGEWSITDFGAAGFSVGRTHQNVTTSVCEIDSPNRRDYAEYIANLDPATVLELVRLAEIGQNTEAKCVWSEDSDGIWTAKCGYTFVSYEGTPLKNKMKFCPSCGSRLFQVRYSARVAI